MASTITRAFTTRRVKNSVDIASHSRANAKEAKDATQLRHKISAPLQLVHTTNMLSYNAPDIKMPSAVSSDASVRSDDESDISSATTAPSAASSPPTSPDVAPDEVCTSPEPNHLSSYFMAPDKKPSAPVTAAVEQPPVIPKRAPSHTKKASYDAIARQRSMSAMSRDSSRTVSTKASMTFSATRSSSSSTTASSVSHSSLSGKASMPALGSAYHRHNEPPAGESHPFGQELAQVSELAEEYGARDKVHVMDEEEKELVAKGYRKFSAEDYISEINGLIASFFPEPRRAPHMATAWI